MRAVLQAQINKTDSEFIHILYEADNVLAHRKADAARILAECVCR